MVLAMILKETQLNKPGPIRLRFYAGLFATFWTLVVGLLVLWNVRDQRRDHLEIARRHAQSAFEKDLVYRRWVANNGGVYVPVSEETPPNPYLSHLKERDIITPSGLKLTLINPAYMTRLVHELGLKQFGIHGHITSLDPIRPQNAPDPWEKEALLAFEKGKTEVSEIRELDGRLYMRLMRPLFTEEACLACHAAQGYELGDIRGGISVSVPFEPIQTIARRHFTTMALGHILLWLLGLGGIGLGTRSLGKRIKERFRAELSRRASEERFRQMAENIGEVFWMQDLDPPKVIYVNSAFEQVFSLPTKDLLKSPQAWLDGVHPDDRKRVVNTLEESQTAEQNVEYRILKSDRSICWIQSRTFPIRNDIGKIYRVVGIAADITERKQAEEELKKSYSQQRDLSRHLQTVREEERSRIAREIHDELGQALTALKMDLYWLHKKLPKIREALQEKSESMLKLINTTIHNVQRISSELRPGLLDDLYLSAAIEWEAGEFANRTGLQVKVSLKPEEISVDRECSTAIFRIFQEAITNIARHAEASEVQVALKREPNQVVLIVRDNGKGITKEQISDSKAYGLIGIRERCLLWGGEVTIKGVRAKGTEVKVAIPHRILETKDAENTHRR